MHELSVFHVCHLCLQDFKDNFRVKSEVFRFDLASAVQAATRASHNLDIIIVALSSLNISDNVLDISETICSGESENDLSVHFKYAFLQILILSRDILKSLCGVNANSEDFFSCTPKNVFQIAI